MRNKLFFIAALISTFVISSASTAPACFLVVQVSDARVIARQEPDCERRTSPASTFKLALAVMGYDSQILVDAHTPAWPYKEEYAAWMESWKTTVDPTKWQADSVVWFSREITRRLGQAKFQQFVDAFDYGNRDLSGDPGQNNGLSNAWLSSSLKISPLEQVAFVRKLIGGQLPVSTTAAEKAKAIIPMFPSDGGWVVYGKTGTGFQLKADNSLDRERQFGWFVGWAQRGDRIVAFSVLINDDTNMDRPAGFRARDLALANLPRVLLGL